MWYRQCLCLIAYCFSITNVLAVDASSNHSADGSVQNVTLLSSSQESLSVNNSLPPGWTWKWYIPLNDSIHGLLARKDLLLPWLPSPHIAAVRLQDVVSFQLTRHQSGYTQFDIDGLIPVIVCFIYVAFDGPQPDTACIGFTYSAQLDKIALDREGFFRGPARRNPSQPPVDADIWPPTLPYGSIEAAVMSIRLMDKTRIIDDMMARSVGNRHVWQIGFRVQPRRWTILLDMNTGVLSPISQMAEPQGANDSSAVNLSSLIAREINLTRINLTETNLTQTSLAETNLTEISLTKANMTETDSLWKWHNNLTQLIRAAQGRRDLIFRWIPDSQVAAIRLQYVTRIFAMPVDSRFPVFDIDDLIPSRICFAFVAFIGLNDGTACVNIAFNEEHGQISMNERSFSEGPQRPQGGDPEIWLPTLRYGLIDDAISRLQESHRVQPYYGAMLGWYHSRRVWLFWLGQGLLRYACTVDLITGDVRDHLQAEMSETQQVNGSLATNISVLAVRNMVTKLSASSALPTSRNITSLLTASNTSSSSALATIGDGNVTASSTTSDLQWKWQAQFDSIMTAAFRRKSWYFPWEDPRNIIQLAWVQSYILHNDAPRPALPGQDIDSLRPSSVCFAYFQNDRVASQTACTGFNFHAADQRIELREDFRSSVPALPTSPFLWPSNLEYSLLSKAVAKLREDGHDDEITGVEAQEDGHGPIWRFEFLPEDPWFIVRLCMDMITGAIHDCLEGTTQA